jgi:hypothetical protein
MSLAAREQRILDGIETTLQAGETRLTSMFAIFTRLSGGRRKTRNGRAGGPVLAAAELAERAAGHGRAFLECLVAVTVPSPVGDRPAAKLRAIALIPVALAAIASLVLLGMITVSMRSCGLVNAGHTSERVLSRAMTCQPSPPVPTPRRGP